MSWHKSREITELFRDRIPHRGFTAGYDDHRPVTIFPVTDQLESRLNKNIIDEYTPEDFRENLFAGQILLFEQDNTLRIIDVNQNIHVIFPVPLNDGTKKYVRTPDMTNAALDLLQISVDGKTSDNEHFDSNLMDFISVVEKAQNAIQEDINADSRDIERANYFFTELSALKNGRLSHYEIRRLNASRDLRQKIRKLDPNHRDAESVPSCAEVRELRATYEQLYNRNKIEEQPDSPESEPGP